MENMMMNDESLSRYSRRFTFGWSQGEPSSYDTRPFFPPGLLDDDLDPSLLSRLGDWESNEDGDFDRLRLLDSDLRLVTRGDTRGLDTLTGERLRTGLRL
ncbi:unnamed protein product [Dovyalis caffra]|uniref:Uncharacterized protein n=1 Tax=Dovyalis caffra TaxID=77055 RepID=A0AAV1SL46_9ROSI|nr:unnamed protein product [Dovyalis caffra]